MDFIDPFLIQSLQLAESSKANGNHPFGALLVYQGQILATAENTVTSDRDVTAHAELNLLRQVSQSISSEILNVCVLYSSTEPCAMCAGAIYWAGITSIVFGCSNQVLSRIVGGSLEIPCREIFQRGNRPIAVSGPVHESHFQRIHEEFWNKARGGTKFGPK